MGLGTFYNMCIKISKPGDILVFVHDDIYIHDWFVATSVRKAMTHFSVVGPAGSRTPDLSQPSWILNFTDDLKPLGWQEEAGLSGAVSHLTPESPQVTYFGEAPSPCLLLDGLFLALDADAVKGKDLQFDEQFDFHCYDLDFCRAATKAGLAIGTWPIPVTHASIGAFGTARWRKAARRYLAKWSQGSAV